MGLCLLSVSAEHVVEIQTPSVSPRAFGLPNPPSQTELLVYCHDPYDVSLSRSSYGMRGSPLPYPAGTILGLLIDSDQGTACALCVALTNSWLGIG